MMKLLQDMVSQLRETSFGNAKLTGSCQRGVVYNGSDCGDCLYSPRGRMRMSVRVEMEPQGGQ